uniref:Fe2OG dioxygenase domain-containing protein n=1 Tax=Brassica oleracea var. oleracea TaxID=109376 RepID=A0A0D3E227_BRAOL
METISALDDIPVVDLSNPNEDLVARAVVKASEEWGIFHVVNHWIPPELIGQLKEVGTEFFQLPESEKKALASEAKRLQEHGRIWPPSRVNHRFWPNNIQDYREVNEEYAKEIKKLSEKIRGWLSEGLGLRRRLLSAVSRSRCEVRTPRHTDLSGITFLIANQVYGLQAFKDNNWFKVKDDDSRIVVIIGDQVHRMNNGKYKRAEHRATLDKEKTRISWPVFVDPNPDHVVRPLPELISGDDNAPKFKPYTYRDYKFHIWNRLPLD